MDEDTLRNELEDKGIIDENGNLTPQTKKAIEKLMKKSEEDTTTQFKKAKIAATSEAKKNIVTGDIYQKDQEDNEEEEDNEEDISQHPVGRIKTILKAINQKEKEVEPRQEES